MWRPRTERQRMTCVWLAPVLIGIGFGTFMGLASPFTELDGNVFIVPGFLAVYVGLTYAILITVLRIVAGAAGRITRDPDITT
jgi:peptidoglycan/LPS O-acetylase OafA/YrhL